MEPVSVHVGGHVTLLFSIHSEALLPRNQGSKGAGFCIEHGVVSTVGISDSDADEISVLNYEGDNFDDGNELYLSLLQEFRKLFSISSPVRIDVALELPVSQGFGMSAAGLLATSLALGEFFNRGDEGQLARLAHRIERENSGGLGDVLGLWAGGCELRTKPGSPPFPGKCQSFSVACQALLVWDPENEKHTSDYIDDEAWISKITKAGEESVSRLEKIEWSEDIWETILSEADTFSLRSGLLEESSRANLLNLVINNSDENMSCHVCMLGTSVIIVPRNLNTAFNVDELASKLTSLGLGVKLTSLQ